MARSSQRGAAAREPVSTEPAPQTCHHGAMRLLVAAMFLLAGCAGVPAGAPARDAAATGAGARVLAAEGYSLAFPAAVTTRSGRDGPSAFRIDAARTIDGARFEAAWFGFPEPLDAHDRATLLARVERGLGGGVGTRVASRALARASGREVVDLVIERADGQRGFHRVLYPSPGAMLQVSAVGPEGGAWERQVPAFFASLTLSGAAAP